MLICVTWLEPHLQWVWTTWRRSKHGLYIAKCNKDKESRPVYLSAYVLTFAFVYRVCLCKTQESVNERNVVRTVQITLDSLLVVFLFWTFWCLQPIVVIVWSVVTQWQWWVVAKATRSTVKELDKAVFGKCKEWILD